MAEQLLCFAGTELLNSNRTLSYLRSGLSCEWSTSNVPECDECECDVSDEGYVDPATDPAPWYDAAVPTSEDFLGLMANVTIDSVIRRTALDLSSEGGFIGRQRPKPRVVAVQGMMFAANRGGLAYGQRWMSEVLAGGMRREEASSDELELLTWCDEDAFRRLLRVGVVDDLIFGNVTDGCTVQDFTFQFAAGVPYLFSRPTTCIDDTTAQNTTGCCLIEAPSWPGDITTRIQLTAPEATAVTNITVSLTPTNGDSCPATDYAPYASFTIPDLPRSTRLTIDSRLRSVTKRNPSSDQEESGWDLLEFNGPFTWLDVAPCAKACLCVAVGTSAGTLTTTVEQYSREL